MEKHNSDLGRRSPSLLAWGFNCAMINEGFGRHQYYLMKNLRSFIRAQKWQVIWLPTFSVSVTATRISICRLLLRIFGSNTHWRWGLRSIAIFIFISVLPSFIIVFVQCRPYAQSWNPKLPGHCFPLSVNTKMALYSGTLAVIHDWTLVTLPITFLWNARIGKKSKVGICILMSMGFFSGVCAVVRTVISLRVINACGHADFS